MNENVKLDGRRRFPRLIACYVLVFVILGLFISVPFYLGFVYFRNDAMTYQLAEYAITRNELAVRDYLLTYRGEADGHNDAINFLAWGITHQDDFIKIVEGVDSAKKPHLCGRLSFAATDTGQVDEFDAGFQNVESECLGIIRAGIERDKLYKQRSNTTGNN